MEHSEAFFPGLLLSPVRLFTMSKYVRMNGIVTFIRIELANTVPQQRLLRRTFLSRTPWLVNPKPGGKDSQNFANGKSYSKVEHKGV